MNVSYATALLPTRFSHDDIVSRWSAEPVAALIAETHGVLTTQWLFLECVGTIQIVDDSTAALSPDRVNIRDFFTFIDELAAALPLPLPAVAGYLSYEALLAHQCVSSQRRSDGGIGSYALYRRVIEIRSDHVREHTLSYENLPSWVVPPHSSPHASLPQTAPQPAITHEAARAYLEQSDPVSALAHHFAEHPHLSAATHHRQVTAIQEMIRRGDVYQVNLSMQLSVLADLDPVALCRWLTGAGRSSQMALLRWPDRLIASASPEQFLHREGDALTCRPIKGTRPRGRDITEDRAHRHALAQSPKDRAELSMIVDLVRNDLHRVCLPGSVAVLAHATIEQHAFVHHTVSTIAGTIAPNTSTFAVWDSLFPSGSISGAPKIAALEAISSLEPHLRDVYCGAIGFFGGKHVSHHNVAIRTLSAENGIVSLWAGGGITIDSDPAREYDECLCKLLTALQLLCKGTPA